MGGAAARALRRRVMIAGWRDWATRLKRDAVAVYLAATDPRVPWLARLMLAVVAAYALSPIDLIPDFIPVIGYLDDLLLVPVGIWLAVRLVPGPVWRDCRARAATVTMPRSWGRIAVTAVVAMWIVGAAALVYWFQALA